MIGFYRLLLKLSGPILRMILKKRIQRGKEDPERYIEKTGQPSRERPSGTLLWLHAASVGEMQSARILLEKILGEENPPSILITTTTLSGARMTEKYFGSRVIHQFYPLDHPVWVDRFLEFWKPDGVLWMESELWPNMLLSIKDKNIPAALINARLSERSMKNWLRLQNSAQNILSAFSKILCQNEDAFNKFTALKAHNVQNTGNLKYAATPLSYDETDLKTFQNAVKNRPVWVYASTHDGEEELAFETQIRLQASHPNLLTIIVPRHPERADEIKIKTQRFGLQVTYRGNQKAPPNIGDHIYIADTFGELGLFYRASRIVCIGRSFSRDGGGGHNPIEAAQLDCAVLCGPNIQNLQDIYDDFKAQNILLQAQDKDDFCDILNSLLSNPQKVDDYAERAAAFVFSQNRVLDKIMNELNFITKT